MNKPTFNNKQLEFEFERLASREYTSIAHGEGEIYCYETLTNLDIYFIEFLYGDTYIYHNEKQMLEDFEKLNKLLFDTYRVTNIEYDTDGEYPEGLPTSIEVKLPKSTHPEEVDNLLSDAISDRTGFCHFGFSFEKVEK